MIKSIKNIKTVIKSTLALILFSVLFQCAENELLTTQTGDSLATTATTTTTSTVSPASCSSCTYVVPVDQHVVDGQALGLKPGNVICLNAALKYGHITFTNIRGTAANPIIITNCGGTVTMTAPTMGYIIRTTNSQYFRITGGNTPKTYGIKLAGSKTNGVSLDYLSTNFEVDHLEVSGTGFAGIMAKTDPSCDNATIRGNFTMRDVSFHDNYIHDTRGEGFYVGHTFFAGYTTSCGVRLPHTIEGAKIYYNIVRRAGWDGIQLSSAVSGAAVYSNTVENYGTENVANQRNGILIGGGTGGTCYNNYVNTGTGTGIQVLGLGDNVVHNNVIIKPGALGIFCDEREGTTGPGFKFINNTIINPATGGIKIYAELVPMNVIINNIIVHPSTLEYVSKLSNVKLELSNNYFTANINDLKFVNHSTYNYRLTSTSPAVNKGKSISTYGISRDFYNTARLKGAAYDIGASEY